MTFDTVVVGAGYAGSVLARRIAEEESKDVLVVERRNHIGGNAYDCLDEYGVLIHKYGPHIFHTSDKPVWDWLSRFTEWREYQHRVLAYVDGRLVPMPIGVETVNELFGLELDCAGFADWLEANREKVEKIETSEDVIISSAGRQIYEKLFKNYTLKQWGVLPSSLDASVTRRIPVRANRDLRYFSDRYQGVPKRGYTKMFENMLDHKRIRVLLNADWKDVKSGVSYSRLVYTGALDELFGFEYGKLAYRSVRFEYETFFDREQFQPVATVNYPNDYDYTRITEYKHITGQRIGCTTIAREYSSSEGDPFYIVPNADRDMVEKYKALKDERTILIGRLAEYEYYNMDQIVKKALMLDLGEPARR